jgi:hypothetical protein
MNNLLKQFTPRTIAILTFMGVVALVRVMAAINGELSPISNFTPLGAMALFGGAYFTRGRAMAFPLLTLWISDIILNRFTFYGNWRLFYEGFYWTYGAFVLMVLIGQYLMHKKTMGRFVLSSLTIVFIHWIVTDIGVWLAGYTYPPTIQGLWMCLLAAIPYELNFLAGTLVYGTLMFGTFEWMQFRFPAIKNSTAL